MVAQLVPSYTPELSGPTARLAWGTLLGLCAWAVVWFALAHPFALAEGTLSRVARMLAILVAVAGAAALLGMRLKDDPARPARALCYVLRCLKIFAEGAIFLILYGTMATTLSYLAASYNAPLEDHVFAMMDEALGFDWLAIRGWLEGKPLLTQILALAYAAAVPGLGFALGVLAVLQDRARITEFLALLALTAIAVVALSASLPAVGACPHHAPATNPFAHVDPMACRWYLEHYLALRDGTFATLDLRSAEGLVTFPSFHAMMAILTTYILRGYWVLFVPALVINSLSVIATIPYGGHYLVDVLGGALITVAAIAIIRRHAGSGGLAPLLWQRFGWPQSA